ncbi:MAG: alpha/beta hydrolase [Mariprofundus sp.]|nr:alpha/beta hydrolase [Mariprofundus sp.]
MMLFITNRSPMGSMNADLTKEVPYEFDLDNNAAGKHLFFCRRDGSENYSEIGSEKLMNELNAGKEKQILFFIHGFSNLPEPDIFPRAQQLQSLLDAETAGVREIRVLPLIWPCDNDMGIVQDYWDDQKSADHSAASMSRLLQKFMAWRHELGEDKQCMKRMNILAHSMGNRVLRETIRAWNKYDLASGVPMLFRNTFLMAADVVNETLEYGQSGELICHASRNVVVYHASDDLALRASKVSNLKNKIASRRLGHTGPENMENAPKNIYAVDCDDFNNSYDYPKGHSYFLDDGKGNPGEVFKHMYKALKTGRVDVGNNIQRCLILEK